MSCHPCFPQSGDAPATAVAQPTMPLAYIKVGVRHRRDLGDIPSLARNIQEIGLLHPIVVRPDGTLIAGARRLAAYKYLGRNEILVKVIDLEKVALGEYAENAFRKDFTPSEIVAIKRDLEPIEREKAKKRMVAAHASPEKFSEQAKGNALDKVAAVVGKHRTTLAKAEAIVDAAEAEPEKFGHLQETMDRTGRVNGVYTRLRKMQQAEAIRKEPPPLPNCGPYRVIVVDAPWEFSTRDADPSKLGRRPYPCMSLEDICKLDIASIAHRDCVLWLWTTNAHLLSGDALAVVKALGFTPKTMLTWGKDRMGTGDWLRGKTEHCILAVRGNPTVTLTNQTTLLLAPARAHSQKPVEFYDLVEAVCAAPRYADLFSRYRHNEKWDCHGDEAPRAEAAE
jgi:N6-adenosine-specific RNA methylase IME4/ParB-like chromosome segregation protein Spo0J